MLTAEDLRCSYRDPQINSGLRDADSQFEEKIDTQEE